MPAVFALFLPEAVRLDLWAMIGGALGKDMEIVAALPLILTAPHTAILCDSNGPENHLLEAAALGLDQSIALLLRARRPDVAPRDRLIALVTEAKLPVLVLPEHGAPFLPPGAVAAMLAGAADRAIDFNDLAHLRPYVGLRDEPNQVDLLMRTLERLLAFLCHDARSVPSPQACIALDAASQARAEVAAEIGVASRATASRSLCALRPFIEAVPEPRARIFVDTPDPSIAALAVNRRALRRLALRLTDPDSLGPWDADAVLQVLAENDVFLDRWERHRLSILCGFFQS